MIAGFAAYRALEAAGIEACESFPDLQFRLAAPTVRLIPKGAGKAALAMRQRTIARLAREVDVDAGPPATLDFADAAILALSARQASDAGTLIALSSPQEGSFVLGLSHAQRRLLGWPQDGACLTSPGPAVSKRADLRSSAPGRVAKASE